MAEPAIDPIKWALKELRDETRQRNYRVAQRFYDGDHPLAFATESFRTTFFRQIEDYADNLCPAVVDSISDRLKVVGFDAGEDEQESEQPAPPAPPDASALPALAIAQPTPVADAARDIWSRNRMDVRAPETHHGTLLKGDGFVLVDEIDGEAVIWSLPAEQMAVSYDPNRPGVIRRAARIWQDPEDRLVHLDLFFTDRIERYVTKGPKTAMLGTSLGWREFTPWLTASATAGLSEAALEDAHVTPHTLGRVPVVHFSNLAYHAYGVGELKDVIRIQKALNKAGCDMLVAMEFAAFPQRWAVGADPGELGPDGKPIQPPFEAGIDRILSLPDPTAKFGDFRAADLTQYVEVQENLRSEIARVSGTPLHYLFITRGDFPSGEAMKSAEARFTRKVENRQASFGHCWEQVMALALVIEGAIEKTDQVVLCAEWDPASPLAAEPGDPVPQTVGETVRL